MRNTTLSVLCMFALCLMAEAQTLKDPDSFLIKEKQLPTVFLVGSFHFAYYNLDAHKVAKNEQIDILSAQKQREVGRLVAYLAQFKPTKIVVESLNSTELVQRYRNYKAGHSALGRDETDQIAFRLANQFKLDTLFAGDALAVDEEMSTSKDSIQFKAYLKQLFDGYDFRNGDTLSKRYETYYKYTSELTTKLPLLDYFQYANSPKALTRGYGAYLIGDFRLGTYRGADALALYWYNRNLRIFRNIQQVTTSPNDRILVLFGQGHICVLDQLFSTTPAYKYIRFGELPTLK